MKAESLVKRFDRAVLRLLAARRRRRQAAGMAGIEAALEELRPGPPGEARPMGAAQPSPPRTPIPVAPEPVGVAVRRRTAQSAGVAALAVLVVTIISLLGPSPPEGAAFDDGAGMVVPEGQQPGTADAGVPKWVREENLRAELQMARQPEAMAMARLVRAQAPGLGRDLIRDLEAKCEDGTEGGWGTVDCDLTQQRAVDAGRELVHGGGETLR